MDRPLSKGGHLAAHISLFSYLNEKTEPIFVRFLHRFLEGSADTFANQ